MPPRGRNTRKRGADTQEPQAKAQEPQAKAAQAQEPDTDAILRRLDELNIEREKLTKQLETVVGSVGIAAVRAHMNAHKTFYEVLQENIKQTRNGLRDEAAYIAHLVLYGIVSPN